ncbi:uncharacterized protein ACNS7B_023049 isoform 2-T2 [Menidia menidia]
MDHKWLARGDVPGVRQGAKVPPCAGCLREQVETFPRSVQTYSLHNRHLAPLWPAAFLLCSQNMIGGRCRCPLLLLWLTALLLSEHGNTSVAVEGEVLLVKNLTNGLLPGIPLNDNNASVTTLVIERNRITLNELDQRALASYPTLVELYLDGNLITSVPARFFSGLQHLRVLSLARNNISSLDAEAFSGLGVLRELDLSHNELTNIPTQIITGLTSLQVLKLQENPLNCSCPLLSSAGGPQIICASPEEQSGNKLEATAVSSRSPSNPTDAQSPPAPVHSQRPEASTFIVQTASPSLNCSASTGDHGNAWRFAACVAALALTTFMLIISAIKGPSWYKHFHNYRHRRLQQEEQTQWEDTLSTVFSQGGGPPTHHTVTFKAQHGQTQEQEQEDGYFEDPYIKREGDYVAEHI